MVQNIHEIIALGKAIVHVWNNTPFNKKMLLILGGFAFLALVNVLFLLPFFFNFCIIPNMEKRLNQKLNFGSFAYRIDPTLKYFKYIEIANYVVFNYLKLSIKSCEDNPLARINYNVKKFTKFEIIMSFISMMSWVIFFLSGIVGLIFFKKLL